MKKFFLLLFLAVSLCLHFNKAFAQQGFVYTSGTKIMTPDSRPLILRGINLGNWLVPEGYMFKFQNTNSPRLINEALNELVGVAATDSFWANYLNSFITADDIHYLKSIGMNSIRVPFNYRLFAKEKYLGQANPEHGFQIVDRLIAWCKKENLYVILDMHCAPGGQTGDNIDDGNGYPFLFESDADQRLTVSIWKRIAQHYKNETVIIGYDLLNEPIATYFNAGDFNPKLESLYKRITAAIRQVDKNHILFLGGAQWDSNFAPFGKPFDSKLVYTFHKYWTSPTQEVIQPYIDFSRKYNVPVYCGETGENTDQWIDSFRITLEKANIGWHFWPYKKMDDKRCVVQFPRPPFYDLIIQYAETPRNNFADIRKNRPVDIQQIRKALDGYVTQCLFRNCVPNSGYIRGLGFSDEASKKRSQHNSVTPNQTQ